MARKGQHFQHYTKEFKMKAVKMYEEGNKSYNTLAEELGLRSSTQLEKIQSQTILLLDALKQRLKVLRKNEII